MWNTLCRYYMKKILDLVIQGVSLRAGLFVHTPAGLKLGPSAQAPFGRYPLLSLTRKRAKPQSIPHLTDKTVSALIPTHLPKFVCRPPKPLAKAEDPFFEILINNPGTGLRVSAALLNPQIKGSFWLPNEISSLPKFSRTNKLLTKQCQHLPQPISRNLYIYPATKPACESERSVL